MSVRELRRLRKRVKELEDRESRRRQRWASEWPSGTIIASAQFEQAGSTAASIRTARALRHAVVATCDDAGLIRFHALPLAGEPA